LITSLLTYYTTDCGESKTFLWALLVRASLYEKRRNVKTGEIVMDKTLESNLGTAQREPEAYRFGE